MSTTQPKHHQFPSFLLNPLAFYVYKGLTESHCKRSSEEEIAATVPTAIFPSSRDRVPAEISEIGIPSTGSILHQTSSSFLQRVHHRVYEDIPRAYSKRLHAETMPSTATLQPEISMRNLDPWMQIAMVQAQTAKAQPFALIPM